MPADKVTREARFAEDLDADSLDLVELVMALEESFDVTVEETELEGIETIGQAYDLIVAKLGCCWATDPTGPSPVAGWRSPASASSRAAAWAPTRCGRAERAGTRG